MSDQVDTNRLSAAASLPAELMARVMQYVQLPQDKLNLARANKRWCATLWNHQWAPFTVCLELFSSPISRCVRKFTIAPALPWYQPVGAIHDPLPIGAVDMHGHQSTVRPLEDFDCIWGLRNRFPDGVFSVQLDLRQPAQGAYAIRRLCRVLGTYETREQLNGLKVLVITHNQVSLELYGLLSKIERTGATLALHLYRTPFHTSTSPNRCKLNTKYFERLTELCGINPYAETFKALRNPVAIDALCLTEMPTSEQATSSFWLLSKLAITMNSCFITHGSYRFSQQLTDVVMQVPRLLYVNPDAIVNTLANYIFNLLTFEQRVVHMRLEFGRATRHHKAGCIYLQRSHLQALVQMYAAKIAPANTRLVIACAHVDHGLPEVKPSWFDHIEPVKDYHQVKYPDRVTTTVKMVTQQRHDMTLVVLEFEHPSQANHSSAYSHTFAQSLQPGPSYRL